MPTEDQPVKLNGSDFWAKHENASVTASFRIRTHNEPMRVMSSDELNTLPYRKQERPPMLDTFASTLPWPSMPPYKPLLPYTRTSHSVEREIFRKELSAIESEYESYRKKAVDVEKGLLKINKALATHMAKHHQ